MNTPGTSLILTYILIHLSLPTIYFMGFERPDYSIYAYEWHYLDFVVALVLPLAVVFNPWRLMPKIKSSARIGRRLAAVFSQFEFPAAIVCLGIAGFFMGSSLLAFRYGYLSISEQNWLIYILLAVKTFLSITLVWSLILLLKYGKNLRTKSRYSAIMFSVAGLFVSSGTVDYFLFSTMAVAMTWPQISHRLMAVRTKQMFSSAFLRRIIFALIPIVFLTVAVVVGDVLKESSNLQGNSATVSERLSEIGNRASRFVSRIVERFSTHFYALNGFHRGFIQEELLSYDHPITYIWEGLKFRFSTITGIGSIERPYIQTLSKLNFEVLSFKISPREGTSPGLLAGFSYVFTHFLGLILALAYVEWLRRLIDGALKGVYLAPLGIVMSLAILLGLFQSPLDFLILVDNAAIWFFSTVFLLQGMPYLKNMKKTGRFAISG